MIDPQQFYIPVKNKKALLVSDTEWGLEELEGLLETLGGNCAKKMLLPKSFKKIDPKTYVGKGKLEEISLELEGLDLLILDFDLSPSQLKNIEKSTKKLILDRTSLILEIFNHHARTKEAKLQVEIARLQYFMPRLTNLWSHFERQRGSGGGSLKGKGMGEKQLEVDRRLVKDRINHLQKKLKEVESVRQLHRKNRQTMLKVAIVGYTNAGKSTLLNALTQQKANALVEDALFATLDAQIKLLNPKSKPSILAIDTVGFIDRLPHSLVASFRSTLGEVLEADLLLQVVDGSHPEYERQFDVTREVLGELGASEIPMFLAINKMDKVEEQGKLNLLKVWSSSKERQLKLLGTAFLSAQDKNQVAELREKILKVFEKKMNLYEILVPFEEGKLLSQLHELARIEKKTQTEKGTFIRFKTMPEFAERMNLSRYQI
ncbi:MAG: GTPase HflX [Bacteriovoracia bacterium]